MRYAAPVIAAVLVCLNYALGSAYTPHDAYLAAGSFVLFLAVDFARVAWCEQRLAAQRAVLREVRHHARADQSDLRQVSYAQD
jgi:hypothetical protein